MLGVTLHRNISQNLFFILIAVIYSSNKNVMFHLTIFVRSYLTICVRSYLTICVRSHLTICVRSHLTYLNWGPFSQFYSIINLTFTFLFELCIMFRLDDARMILSVSPHVSSSWAIVTLLKSLYSLSPSNVVITNPHTEIRELQLFRTC